MFTSKFRVTLSMLILCSFLISACGGNGNTTNEAGSSGQTAQARTSPRLKPRPYDKKGGYDSWSDRVSRRSTANCSRCIFTYLIVARREAGRRDSDGSRERPYPRPD